MTYGAFTHDYASYAYEGRARSPVPQAVLCAVALGLTVAAGVWTLDRAARAPVATPRVALQVVQLRPAAMAPIHAVAKTPLTRVARAEVPALRRDAGFLDPSAMESRGSISFARSAALRAALEPRPMVPPPVVVAKRAEVAPQVTPQVPVVSEVVEAEAARAEPAKSAAEASFEEASLEVKPDAVPIVRDVPLPLPRPAGLSPAAKPAEREVTRVARVSAEAPVAAAPTEEPTLFDKLFHRPNQNGPALAYAAPEDSALGNVLKNLTGAPAPVDNYTAVYDISAHTVYMPDGTRLEAHSGLGAALDNPRSVAQHMVGATPPNVYLLSQRESLFHNVRALRLTPTGGTTYGRGGLLAHTYMLRGRSGESNGCVVFKDYAVFLRAYDSGRVKRLAVVASRT